MSDPIPQTPVSQPVPLPIGYVIVICTIVICTILGLLIVMVVRPHEDNTGLNAQILGLLAPTIASILAFGRSQQTAIKVDKLHDSLNGHVRTLVAQTATAAELSAHAASVAQGHAEGLIRGIETVLTKVNSAPIVSPVVVPVVMPDQVPKEERP